LNTKLLYSLKEGISPEANPNLHKNFLIVDMGIQLSFPRESS